MAVQTPRYLSQLSRDWLLKIEKGTNLKAGKGILITPDGDGFRIELDPEIFKQWLWTATYRSMIKSPIGGGVCLPNMTLGQLSNILLDPIVAS